MHISGIVESMGYEISPKSNVGTWDIYGTNQDKYVSLESSLIGFHCIASFELNINNSLSLLEAFIDNCRVC